MTTDKGARAADSAEGWDHSSRSEFLEYYQKQSLSAETRQRFESLRDRLLRLHREASPESRPLAIADVGGGAGSLAAIWAEAGHRVYSIDISLPLIQLAQERALAAGLDANFAVASATDLPWASQSMDICLAPELLEHVADWQACLDEFARVLRPGGLLFLSTTNLLCPKQQEFNLRVYSWYPGFLKRRYEKLAVTTRPELANHATYPAVNWFSFYSLRTALRSRGFADFRDRFDLAAMSQHSREKQMILQGVRRVPGLRLLAQFCTSGTTIVGRKAA